MAVPGARPASRGGLFQGIDVDADGDGAQPVAIAARDGQAGLRDVEAVFLFHVVDEDGINISQTSLTISRSNGYRVGAVTIGINVDALK